MAQRSATVRVDGVVVKSERKTGTMVAQDTGQPVSWDYIEARVLTAEFDTVEVRFPSNESIPVPGRDEVVSLLCEARPSGGNLRLTVTAVQPSLSEAPEFFPVPATV